MGRREIIIGALLATFGLGGTAMATGYGMTANGYTPLLIRFGWAAITTAAFGLIWMYATAPKAHLNSLTKPEREFLPDDITTDVLRQKIKGRTNVQVAALATTYAGKWMKLEGRVHDVCTLSSVSDDKWMVFLSEDGRSDNYSMVSIVFFKKWHNQLAALNKGDWLSVVACLTGFQSGPVFDHGEIVHMGEPPNKPELKARAPRKKAGPKPAVK